MDMEAELEALLYFPKVCTDLHMIAPGVLYAARCLDAVVADGSNNFVK